MAAQRWFESNLDPLKRVDVDVDSLTTNTTRVITIPNRDGTLFDAASNAVTPTGNLTSSNTQDALVELQGDIDGIRTTRSQGWTRIQSYTVDTLTYGGVMIVDLSSQSGQMEVTLTGDISDLSFSSAVAGEVWYIDFIQDGTGGRTLTHAAAISNPNTLTIGTAANQRTRLEYYYNGAKTIITSSANLGT